MKTFYLQRNIDSSGVSGTGKVAEGIQYKCGKVTICWLPGDVHSIEVYDSIEQLEKIHGHNGNTVVEWTKDRYDSLMERVYKELERRDKEGNF